MPKDELVRSARSPEAIKGLERVEPKFSYVNEIKEKLEETVFGQSEAMEALARAVGRHENGLSDPNRPLGVLLFAGPTGVGKTEAARALSDYLFEEGGENIKIVNCAEFSQPHTISRIVGAPPGYVGFGGTTLITRDFLARRNVIVFDEIEKADQALWRLLLSAIDTGHLNSTQTVRTRVNNEVKSYTTEVDLNFTNSYIVFTSNIGTEEISKNSLGFVAQENADMKKSVRAAIVRHFRAMPEFLDRMDDTIVFNHLTEDDYMRVFWKFADRINENMDLMDYHPFVTITDRAAEYLVHKVVGDGRVGARQIRSAINREITQPLSDIIYDCMDRAYLVADLEDGKIVFYQSEEINPASLLPPDGELISFDEIAEEDEQVEGQDPPKAASES